MKFPAFDYARPTSVAEAVALLTKYGDQAVILAGGQSLMPLLAFRLAAPELVVDLKNVAGLDTIEITSNIIRIGASVRWRDIEQSAELAEALPLLVEAVRHVAHYQIRNRGTVGGSLALADPAAELPGVAMACSAEVAVVGSAGERLVSAENLFLGSMTTCLETDDVITELRFPAWPVGRRWAFMEFSRRRGDFALAGVALYFDLDGAGNAENTRIGVIGVGDRPQRLMAAEDVINGEIVNDTIIKAAAEVAANAVDPMDDHHAPAAYRRALIKTLVERSLRQAAT